MSRSNSARIKAGECTISAIEAAQFILGDTNQIVNLPARKGLPQQARIEIAVFVPQNIADGADSRPRNRWLPALDVRFEQQDVAHGFRYTEQAKIDEIMQVGIGRKGFLCHAFQLHDDAGTVRYDILPSASYLPFAALRLNCGLIII
jgi:hypothetical protein